MSGLPFHKYVSLGNDFVLIGESDVPGGGLDELARKLCDQRLGVGSDGLLVFYTDDDRARMRMFNPDGTEDFCGNGLRCAALHARRQGHTGDSITILHGGSEIHITFAVGGWIDVLLPAPSFEPKLVPLADGVGELFDREVAVEGRKVRLCALSTGTTHTVVLRDGPPSDEEFAEVSAALENHAWFPERTSVIWAWDEGPKKIRIRIWERGVGETLGCGTGSAAAAACRFRKNPNLLALEVINPGGEAAVARGAVGGILVSARARHVFSGETLAAGASLAPRAVAD
ncbi:MAG: diaminopimelate epimerase [Armatimonadetes bacterium]|nr:diaminopimelate epimerase [Armatimonadota bacterium]